MLKVCSKDLFPKAGCILSFPSPFFFFFFHFSTGHFAGGISPFPAPWQPGLIFQFNTVGNIYPCFFFCLLSLIFFFCSIKAAVLRNSPLVYNVLLTPFQCVVYAGVIFYHTWRLCINTFACTADCGNCVQRRRTCIIFPSTQTDNKQRMK